MSATVTSRLVGGCSAIVMENRHVSAVVLPSLGGRVWELWDRARARQWLWHRDDVPLCAHPVGVSYDDVWAGGWEELFPNDAPGRFEGRELPDHGEWWATPWKLVESTGGAVAKVRLETTLSVVKVSCSKEFSLAADSSTLSVAYRIRSEEVEPFHFLFKQHLPIALTGDCRLALPGGDVRAVEPGFGTHVTGTGWFPWPLVPSAAGSVDLREVPPPARCAREFVCVRNLPDAWCGVVDVHRGASLKLSFDLAQLPCVWLFLTYGGWHGLHTAVIEPCSNLTKDLAEAARLRQAASLEPGQEWRTRVAVALGPAANIAP